MQQGQRRPRFLWPSTASNLGLGFFSDKSEKAAVNVIFPFTWRLQ